MAEHFTCAICLEFTSDHPSRDYFVSTKGGHIFHFLCIRQHLENGEDTCPICREVIELSNLTRLYGIKLKKSTVTLRLQSDGSDGTLPSMKIVVLGNSTVGKTSLLRRFSNQKFIASVNPTCGCDVVFRNIAVGGKVFRLNLWDTAGQENFKSVVSTTVRGAQGIIFVFDVTDYQTLNDIEAWLEFANKYCPIDCVKILLGNKIDLQDGRKVSQLIGQAVGEKLNLPFFETSAKTGANVEAVFRALVGQILELPYILAAKNEINAIELEVPTVHRDSGSCNC